MTFLMAPRKDGFAPNFTTLPLKSNQGHQIKLVLPYLKSSFKSQTLTHNENMLLKHNPPQAMILSIHDLKSKFHVHCTLTMLE